MKPSSVGPPKLYLGGKVVQVILANGAKAWSFSASQYVHGAIHSIEEYLESRGMNLSEKKALLSLPTNYILELDISPELLPEEAACYQSLVRILH